MKKIQLGLEKTIAGFLLLIAIFFILLKLLKIDNIGFLLDIKSYYLPYISIGALAISYVIGTVADIIIKYLLTMFLLVFGKLLKINLYKTWYERLAWRYNFVRYVRFLQNTSEKLWNEFESKQKQLVLIRLLFFATPFLGFSIPLWLGNKVNLSIIVLLIIISIITFISLSVALIEQRKSFLRFKDDAFNEIEINWKSNSSVSLKNENENKIDK